MVAEVIQYLITDPNGVYVDATVGGGGHAKAILEKTSPQAVLVGIDRDREAIEIAGQVLAEFGTRVKLVQGSFSRIAEILIQENFGTINGILFDLGVSSRQLDISERGFSFSQDGPLDMRMDQTKEKTAEDVVNNYTKEELTRILYEYGEEKNARRIAEAIVYKRQKDRITTTCQLADIIKEAYPAKERFNGKHPARKTFQAIRIEVNDELNVLKEMLPKAAFLLKKNGRLAVITFHSLEDRIVKNSFNELINPCTCPKSFPVCVCNKVAQHKLIVKKPLIPKSEETQKNYRSRSSKLRILERT